MALTWVCQAATVTRANIVKRSPASTTARPAILSSGMSIIAVKARCRPALVVTPKVGDIVTALSLKSFKRDRSRSTVSRRAYQELPGYSLCESIDSYNQGFEKFQIKREWCLFTLNFDYHGQANIALVKDARQIRGRVTRRRVRPVLFPPSPSDTRNPKPHSREPCENRHPGGSFLIFCVA